MNFQYPISARQVLRGFNLEIAPGQMVILAGPSDTGKSTQFNLLCRFYDPDSGEITLDGIPLREIVVAQLRRSLSVFFAACTVQRHGI